MPVLPDRESLTVEFKSDRGPLPDRDLIAAVVCLANTEGGELWVGVEDDGTPTGLAPEHRRVGGIAALVANRTVPSQGVRVEAVDTDSGPVARIEVPKSPRLVATSDGLMQRRRLMADGTPQCVPLYPHEIDRRASDLALLDVTERPVLEASADDLDPLERERLRQIIDRYRGDRSLLDLPDAELDGALGLTVEEGGRVVPTVLGLLLIGREGRLKRFVPGHEVAFQVLDGTDVRVNEFSRKPLLKVFEEIDTQFRARASERELDVGLYRVPVPSFDGRAFREAVVNALSHRDFTRLGAVHIKMTLPRGDDPGGIEIHNPGGFVEGVSPANILTVFPRPRNPRLADALKRVGLAERTGRGVDRIFAGLLRYGRPAPDYSRSDAQSVTVELAGGEADLGLLRLIIEREEQVGDTLPVDTVITLARLRRERRVDVATIAAATQKGEGDARATLERLVEAGLVERQDGRTARYTLSAEVYRELDEPAGYVRQKGFDRAQQEAAVLRYARAHDRITRGEVEELCHLPKSKAVRLVRKLVEDGDLIRRGGGQSTYYTARDTAADRAGS